MKQPTFKIPIVGLRGILLLFLINYTSALQAQWQETGINPESQVLASPNVASLGTYGLFKNSKYTGMADINFPIYEMSFEELNLPISLSYSQAGLMPKKDASWVGLGWSLSSQAVIYRSIKDGDDIRPTYGWIFQPNYEIETYSPDFMPIPDQKIIEIHNASQPRFKPDMEPDVFTVNLFGKNIKFLIPKPSRAGLSEIKCESFSHLTYNIVYKVDSQEFEVTDDLGYKYYFSVKEYSNFDADNSDIITAWFVTSILSPNGKELIFEYDHSGTVQASSTAGVWKRTFKRPVCTPTGGWKVGEIPGWSDKITQSTLTGNRNSSVVLTAISDGIERIDFHTSNRKDIQEMNDLKVKKLDQITISYKGNVKKTIDFSYSYFNKQYLNDPEHVKYLRLMLTDLTVGRKVHSFKYMTPDAMPIKSTSEVDALGYYNGKPAGLDYPYYEATLYCSGTSHLVKFEGSNKESDFDFAKVGQLYQITYPTGGSTVFNYEPHTVKLDADKYYPWEVTDRTTASGGYRNKVIGGLRIGSVENFNMDGTLLTKKSYKYVDSDGKSTGKLMTVPKFASQKYVFVRYTWGEEFNKCYVEEADNDYIETSNYPKSYLSNSAMGGLIGYSKVKESQVSNVDPADSYTTITSFINIKGATGQARLKEEDYVGFPLNMCRFNVKYYYYTSYRTNQIGEPITFEEQNGKVKAEEVYDTEGQLVKSTSNTYKFLSKGRIGGIKLFMRPASYFREHRFRVDAFQNYIHELRVHVLDESTVTFHFEDGTSIVSNQSAFDYNDQWQLVKQTATDSKNQTTELTFRYPEARTSPYLAQLNMYGKLLQQSKTVDGVVADIQYLSYDLQGRLGASRHHIPNDLYPESYTQSQYTYYDDDNVKEIIDRDGMVVTFIWDKDGKYVVARVEGLGYDDLISQYPLNVNNLEIDVNDQSTLKNELEGLRQALSSPVELTYYTIDPLIGITSSTDLNGKTVYYEYNPDGQLVAIKDNDGNIVNAYDYHSINYPNK